MQYLHTCHCLHPLYALIHLLDTRSQPILVLGVIILQVQVQDPAFTFAEFQRLPLPISPASPAPSEGLHGLLGY